MDTASLSLLAKANGAGLVLTCRFDGAVRHSVVLEPQIQQLDISFSDSGVHCLELELTGKRADHTVIDPDGNIVQDVVAEISQVRMEGIDLGHVFFENCQYLHDHNGTTAPLVDGFFGIMGCNGRVHFRFQSPIYLWLLEHM